MLAGLLVRPTCNWTAAWERSPATVSSSRVEREHGRGHCMRGKIALKLDVQGRIVEARECVGRRGGRLRGKRSILSATAEFKLNREATLLAAVPSTHPAAILLSPVRLGLCRGL
jgi:hypothetical protein